MAKLNGVSNFTQWSEDLDAEVQKLYGDLHKIIRDPLVVRPTVDDVIVNAKATAEEKARSEIANRRLEERIKRWDSNESKVFGLIIDSLENDFRYILLSNAEFEQTARTDDAVALMSMIRSICSSNATVNKATAIMEMESRLDNVKMGPSDTIQDHIQKLRVMFRDVEMSGLIPLPLTNQATKAIKSIAVQCPEVANQLLIMPPPESLHSLFETMLRLYNAHVSTVGASAGQAHVGVSKAIEDKTSSNNLCDFCGKANHRAVNKKGEPNCYLLKRKLNGDKKMDGTGNEKVAYVANLKKDTTYSTLPTNSTPIEVSLMSYSTEKTPGFFYDSGCSSHWFHDKTLFENLEPCNTPIEGIGGTAIATHKGMTQIGMAYFGNTPLNLVSPNQFFRDNKNRAPDSQIVTLYNSEKNIFSVRLGRADIRANFKPHPKLGIPYSETLPFLNKPNSIAYVSKETPHTHPRVKKRADEAVKLHMKLNHPSDEQLCRTLNNGGIRTTVTANDVKSARALYGPCCGCNAGKHTNSTTGGQYNNANRLAQHLHADIIYIPTGNGKSSLFHLSSDEYSTDIKVYPMEDQTAASIHKAQLQLINSYKSQGHHVDTIFYDDASNIRATEVQLNAIGVKLSQAPANEHDKHAEAACRVIKSRMRSVLSTLPYNLPSMLLRYLIQDVCDTRSLVTTINSGHQTPFQLTNGGDSIDASSILAYAFGEGVQFHDLSRENGLLPRASYGIIVGRDLHRPDKAFVWDISTSRVIHRSTKGLEPLELTTPIIQCINRTYESSPYAADDVLYTDKSQASNPYDQYTRNIISKQRRGKISTKPNNTPTENTKASNTNPAVQTAPKEKEMTTDDNVYDIQYNDSNRDERMRRRSQQKTNDESPQDDPTITQSRQEEHELDTDNEAHCYDQPSEVSVPATAKLQRDRYEGFRPNEIALAEIILGKPTFATHLLNLRGIQDKDSPNEVAFSHMSLNQMLNQGEEGKESAVKEISQILTRETWHPISSKSLTTEEKRGAISCHGVGTVKRDGTRKTRVVAGGHTQDKSKYPDMISPTSSHTTTMIHLTVAAYEKRPYISQIDYPGAYLGIDRSKHDMPTEIMRVSGKLAKLVIEVDPTYANYEENGSFYVELDKSLYGLLHHIPPL